MKYGLKNSDEIHEAIRTGRIPECGLVMDWIELMVYELYLDPMKSPGPTSE